MSASELAELIALLRREGRYSGVWFGEHLLKAADMLSTLEGVNGLIEKHIQRCREAVAECPKWSPAQAEWSRARDALLNLQDDIAALSPMEEIQGARDLG